MVVMQSLTKNGRKVFWILLLHQKEHSSDGDYNGIVLSTKASNRETYLVYFVNPSNFWLKG